MTHRVSLKKGAFYIVSTPIGNIKDITLRALETLQQVDILFVEDTRSVQYLLNFYKIKDKKIVSYHSYNEKQRIPYVLDLLKAQNSIALLSDAGTPLISDPGFLLIDTLIQNNIEIIGVPGVTALTTALPLSGYPLGDFYFSGFLSPKEGKRKNQLIKLKEIKTVIVLYESPHRLLKTIENMYSIFEKTTPIFIARELTKTYETLYRGNLEYIFEMIKNGLNNFVCKGEFVIIIHNHE